MTSKKTKGKAKKAAPKRAASNAVPKSRSKAAAAPRKGTALNRHAHLSIAKAAAKKLETAAFGTRKKAAAPAAVGPTIRTGDGRVLSCTPGLVVKRLPPVPKYVPQIPDGVRSFQAEVHGESRKGHSS